MKLWDRIHRGMDAGFDAALSAVHSITEKAGEGIELTRLRREKARLETQVTKLLAELGNAVYEKISIERLDDVAKKLQIRDVIMELAESEARMVDIDRRVNKELENQEKARQFGRAGHSRAEKKISLDKQIDSYLNRLKL